MGARAAHGSGACKAFRPGPGVWPPLPHGALAHCFFSAEKEWPKVGSSFIFSVLASCLSDLCWHLGLSLSLI